MDVLGAGLVPLAGGYSGETFLAEAAGERSVVRIYAHSAEHRGPDAPEIDAALLRLVRGLLPVPEVLEVRRADPDAATPGLLVTSYLPGERLDVALATADEPLRSAIGEQLGRLLARLAQMPMLRAGLFADPELRIAPMPPGATDLVEWVDSHAEDTALAEWQAADLDALRKIADEAQVRLETVDRVCLVHSDFNPKNLLVDPDTGVVTGLVDWEFAHAGNPFTDLGNLLRFERDPVLVESVLAAYRSGLGRLDQRKAPDQRQVLELARSADLWALVDLAARRDANPVARRAHDLLLTIARTGDLHAEPGA
jgi:aminoglycoside phosphotransferase (APT) family kinase protein